MQAVMYMPIIPNMFADATNPIIPPVLRETVTINTGTNAIGKVQIYKDDLLRALNKPFTEPFNVMGNIK